MTTYVFYTYNIDFAKGNLPETQSLHSVRDAADVICVQEAKHLSVRTALGPDWPTHQALINEAMQGVAIAWRRDKVSRAKQPTSKVAGHHKGYVIGTLPGGVRMLTRYINYRDLLFNGHVVRVVSTHRPPQRYKRLWSQFDRNLARFVKNSPYPVIIGMDSNTTQHASFEKMSGMVWYGVGIDGFYLSKSLKPFVIKNSLHEHPKSHSDHHPVSIKLNF